MPNKASKQARPGILKRRNVKGKLAQKPVDDDSDSSTLGLKISSINSLRNGFVENYEEPSGSLKGWRNVRGGYQCKQCHVEFGHMNLYREHKQVYRIGQHLNCKHCTSSFSSKCDLNSHEKFHWNEKLWCKICEVRFKTIQAAQEHEKQCHSVEIMPEAIDTLIGNVTSNQSDTQSSNGVTLFSTLTSETSGSSNPKSRKLKCPMCPFESHDIPGLKNHVEICKLRLANGNLVYCCSQCNFSSRFREVFGDHYIWRLEHNICIDQNGYWSHDRKRQPRKRSSTEWRSDDCDSDIQILHQDNPNPAIVTHIIEPTPSASAGIRRTKVRLIGNPTDNLIFTCPKCGKNYFTARSLEDHLKIDCTAIKTRFRENSVDSKSWNNGFVCSYSCRFCRESLNSMVKARSHGILCKHLPHPQTSFVVCDLCLTPIGDLGEYSRHAGRCAMNLEKRCDEVIYVRSEEEQ